MNIKMNKQEVNVVVEREKPAIRLYGSNRSQHRPMDEEYDISYSELKEMSPLTQIHCNNNLSLQRCR